MIDYNKVEPEANENPEGSSDDEEDIIGEAMRKNKEQFAKPDKLAEKYDTSKGKR